LKVKGEANGIVGRADSGVFAESVGVNLEHQAFALSGLKVKVKV
jgi:hypothetical protein